jgi:hypothetical protein
VVILGFVIIPAILDSAKTWQTVNDPVVVRTTKYGKIKTSDLQNMRSRHDRIVRVFSSLLSKATGQPEQMIRPYLERQVFGDSKEEMLLNRWLIARKAEELGVNASDQAIDNFTDELLGSAGKEKLTDKDFNDSLALIGRYTMRMFYEDMRDFVRISLFINSNRQSLGSVTPGQRWDYYCRVNREATIACVPVKVENFVGEIKKPDDETLKAYFEKYKDRTPDPYSPEPGFRAPQRIEIAYFSANIDKFADPEKITEEEIQAQYEKNANQYDLANSKEIARLTEEAATKEKEEAEKKKAENKETSGEVKSGEGDKPAANAPQTPAPEGEKKETAPMPATGTPADQPAEKKSSSIDRSPYRFASLQAEGEKDQPAPAATETPKPIEPAAKTEPAAGEAKPAETKPVEPTVGGAETKPSPSSDITLPPEKPKGETARLLTEKVRKDIRRDIAIDKIRSIFEKIEAEMKDYAAEKRRFDANVEGAQKPAEFDYDGLAKQYGIETKKTGPITVWEAVEMDIGKSGIFDRSTGQSRNVAGMAFDNPENRSGISKHAPIRTIGNDNIYLLWKTEDAKESEPKWENASVQEQVLTAWKLEKARDLALKQAKQIADDAKKNKMPLKDVVADKAGFETITPPPFAWYLSSGYIPGRMSYSLNSDIEKLDKPGNEFLKTVFGLEEQGTGTAFNEPKTIVYAIQAEKFAPSTDVLWENFLKSNPNEYVGMRSQEVNEASIKLIEELKTEAGVEWLRKPDHYEKETAPQR